MRRTALVTGASRGIGRGIAMSLARQGFGLTITSRTEPDLRDLAVALRDAGAPQVAFRAADMTDHDALPAVVELHRATYGRLHALILNAGTGTAGPIGTIPLRRHVKIFDVNLTSAVVLLQSALPLLRAGADDDPRHGARVIGLSSITGVFAQAGFGTYGASKAALLSLLETFNVEESGQGVAATTIAPAYVDTDMAAWTADTIPAATMIPVADVVAAVDLVLGLNRNTSITRIVLSRSGTSGHVA